LIEGAGLGGRSGAGGVTGGGVTGAFRLQRAPRTSLGHPAFHIPTGGETAGRRW
jgi:hypothetical protein